MRVPPVRVPPVTTTPMRVAPTMVMVTPLYFFRLQAVALFLRCHGGMRGTLRRLCILLERLRVQRRRLSGYGEACETAGYTCCNLEKFPTFHVFLLARSADVLPRLDECVQRGSC